jgi:hypothetical protein
MPLFFSCSLTYYYLQRLGELCGKEINYNLALDRKKERAFHRISSAVSVSKQKNIAQWGDYSSYRYQVTDESLLKGCYFASDEIRLSIIFKHKVYRYVCVCMRVCAPLMSL